MSAAEDLRRALKVFDPALRVAEQVLAMRPALTAAIKAADELSALDVKRRQLADEVGELEGRISARTMADQQERTERLRSIENEVGRAQSEATQTRERVAAETRDFIAEREKDRQKVAIALAQEQENLRRIRAINQQAEQERIKAKKDDERESAERKAGLSAEMDSLERSLKIKREAYREIQEKLAAVSAASR